MNRTKRNLLFLTLVLTLLAITTSIAFAKELGLLTISGPGIKGEVSLKDPEAMMNLEKSGFFDQAFLSQPPKGVDIDKGFHMTAHLNLDGEMVPYIQMVYYPTNEGQAGYIHYTGRLEGKTLQSIDEWHLLNLKADGALRELMTANGITVTSTLVTAPAAAAPAKEPVSAPAAEPVAAPATAPLQLSTPSLMIALVVGLLALVGAALAIKRRTVTHSTS